MSCACRVQGRRITRLQWILIKRAAHYTPSSIGLLTPGKRADVFKLRTDNPNVFPVNDPIGVVVWSMDTSNVDSDFVSCKPLKRNGEFLHAEWNAVKKAMYESHDDVIKKSEFSLPKI